MRRSLTLVLACIASTAAAQNAPRPDPTDPKARTPKIEYRSSFEGYRPYKEPELASWREVNAEAGSLGGHRGQLQKQPAVKQEAHK